MQNNLRVVSIEGREFTIEGNRDIIYYQDFLTTHDLESEDFKKVLVNFVNKFVRDVIWKTNFIKQESLDIEGVNNLLSKIGGIEDNDEDTSYHSFECEVLEPKETLIEALKFIPPNVNVTSIKDLKELGIEALDLSTIELLNEMLIRSKC